MLEAGDVHRAAPAHMRLTPAAAMAHLEGAPHRIERLVRERRAAELQRDAREVRVHRADDRVGAREEREVEERLVQRRPPVERARAQPLLDQTLRVRRVLASVEAKGQGARHADGEKRRVGVTSVGESVASNTAAGSVARGAAREARQRVAHGGRSTRSPAHASPARTWTPITRADAATFGSSRSRLAMSGSAAATAARLSARKAAGAAASSETRAARRRRTMATRRLARALQRGAQRQRRAQRKAREL